MKKLIFLLSLTLVFTLADAQRLASKNGKLDATTQAQSTITYEHNEVHAGSHYAFTAYDASMASGDTLAYVITTPNTTSWPHVIFIVDGQLVTSVEMDTKTKHKVFI